MHLHHGINLSELLMDQEKAVPWCSKLLVSLLGQGFFAKLFFFKISLKVHCGLLQYNQIIDLNIYWFPLCPNVPT